MGVVSRPSVTASSYDRISVRRMRHSYYGFSSLLGGGRYGRDESGEPRISGLQRVPWVVKWFELVGASYETKSFPYAMILWSFRLRRKETSVRFDAVAITPQARVANPFCLLAWSAMARRNPVRRCFSPSGTWRHPLEGRTCTYGSAGEGSAENPAPTRLRPSSWSPLGGMRGSWKEMRDCRRCIASYWRIALWVCGPQV